MDRFNTWINKALSKISLHGSDIKYYSLVTPMDKTEYMKVQLKHILEDIRVKYNLYDKVTSNDYVYTKTKKGMYGLRQVTIPIYKKLQDNMKPFECTPILGTVCVWQHATRPTTSVYMIMILVSNITMQAMYSISWTISGKTINIQLTRRAATIADSLLTETTETSMLVYHCQGT